MGALLDAALGSPVARTICGKSVYAGYSSRYTDLANTEHSDMSNVTQEAVTESLNVAVDENGYRELIGMPAEEAAIDLINCNPDFEECEVNELLPFVKVWQDARK